MEPIKTFIALLFLVFCGLQCGSNEAGSESAEITTNTLASDQPNIILIVADDHGKDAIGAYGNPVIQTPNLDRLAATGTLFNRAFCTTASCSASRSVILSGLHNHANG